MECRAVALAVLLGISLTGVLGQLSVQEQLATFPYCPCDRNSTGPYYLTYTTKEKLARGLVKYCYELRTNPNAPPGPCAKYDLRKLEFDMKPECQGAAVAVEYNGYNISYSYQTFKNPTRTVFKMLRGDGSLAKYDDLKGKVTPLCLTLRPLDNRCSELKNFYHFTRIAFFSPDLKCCTNQPPVPPSPPPPRRNPKPPTNKSPKPSPSPRSPPPTAPSPLVSPQSPIASPPVSSPPALSPNPPFDYGPGDLAPPPPSAVPTDPPSSLSKPPPPGDNGSTSPPAPSSNTYPYHQCSYSGSESPYTLTWRSSTTYKNGSVTHCFRLTAAVNTAAPSKCSKWDLRKLEFAMAPKCAGSVSRMWFGDKALSASYQHHPGGDFDVFKVTNSVTPLGTFDSLKAHSTKLCMHMGHKGWCTKLENFCSGPTCKIAYFSYGNTCCPVVDIAQRRSL